MNTAQVVIFFVISFSSSLLSQTIGPFTITLDGNIDQNEWKNAKAFSLERGGQVRVMIDTSNVYVAISSDEYGWSHVYIREGTTVYVLHASAALGASIYVLQDDKRWKATQSFKWGLRNKGLTEGDKNDRLSYFKKNGWVATVTEMHPNNNEFVISRSLVKDEPIRLAVLRTADSKSSHYWPATLKDGTLNERLVKGQTPETLIFDSATWGTVQ